MLIKASQDYEGSLETLSNDVLVESVTDEVLLEASQAYERSASHKSDDFDIEVMVPDEILLEANQAYKRQVNEDLFETSHIGDRVHVEASEGTVGNIIAGQQGKGCGIPVSMKLLKKYSTQVCQ